MAFTSHLDGVRHRFVDVSFPAVSSDLFPPSVGFRTQTLTLRPVLPDMPGYFIRPEMKRPDPAGMLQSRQRGNPVDAGYFQTYIGEILSLIYAPFYDRTGSLVDAVVDKPVRDRLPEDFDPFSFPGGPAESRFGFLPALCPDCGRDLEGETSSHVLNCLNCHTSWQPPGSGVRLAKLGFAYAEAFHRPDRFYPFWRIQANVSGIYLKSVADWIRLANLPRAIRPEWEKTPFCFWVPAFKIQPKTWMMLSTRLTGIQPTVDPGIEHGKGVRHAVTMPVLQAAEGIRICLANAIRPAETWLPRLQTVNIRPVSYRLVYIPFEEGHHEWLHPEYRLAIPKSHVTLSKNL